MSRNAAYKMPGLKFASTTKARAQRMDEQNKNRQMARQAKNDAKRGLVEIDQNVFNVNGNNNAKDPVITAEKTHEQKLQERLARLKIWREQKVALDQKAKAKKKVPFVVPGVTRGNKPTVEAILPPVSAKPAGRVTRSQTKAKPAEPEKQWIVTLNRIPTEKKTTKCSNPIEESFAPKDFVFTAPKEIAVKAMELQDTMNVTKAELPTVETPQKPKPSETENEDVQISPLLINHPWITTTRGSSSKKQRQSMEAAADEEHLSSPLLKKRSENYRNSVAPVNPHAHHFRAMMASEGSRLTDLCSTWEELLSKDEVPEEETGSVRTVIGQAQLLQRERFTQFAGLVNQFETKTGEKEITPTDLEGFWEMIYLQVSDVDKKFEDLTRLKENGWVAVEKVLEPQKKSKVIKKKATGAQTRPAKSNIRALIAAARKKQLAEQSSGSPSVNKRRSSLLMSPIRTPGKRQSLRRSVLLLSAKKPVFIVTEMVPPRSEEQVGNNQEPESIACTPKRSSRRLNVDSKSSPVSDNEQPTMEVTPGHMKTYARRIEHATESISPEERLSAAFDALKNDAESYDHMTPLKVFRSPLDSKRSNTLRKSLHTTDVKTEDLATTFTPRRSTRIRGTNERVSLLPTASISPVVPADDLMSFD